MFSFCILLVLDGSDHTFHNGFLDLYGDSEVVLDDIEDCAVDNFVFAVVLE